MSYSYSAPLTYDMQAQQPAYYREVPYNQQQSSSSSVPYTATGFLAGAGVGAYIGNNKHPMISKKGEISDTLSISAYEKYLDKTSSAGSKAYEQGLNILRDIDKINSSDELKILLNANEDAVKEICTELEEAPSEFLKNITNDNLSANKKTIKERINAANNNRYQDMKNKIQSCWDRKSKKLKKPDNMSKELYNVIKEAANQGKTKMIAKYALIGGAITGVLGYITHKIFNH